MKQIFILTFLLLNLTHSKAQSKEETISWIKSKLESHLYNSLNKNFTDKIELDECYCTIYYTSKTNMGELKNIVKIPTNIISIDEWLVPQHNNIEHYVYKQKKKKTELISKYYNKENSFPLYIREGETDLSSRLLKAFKHLNSFCSNKKETF
jgi:hypothetical protein